MIRDRIIVGILDKSLAERLQLDAVLTLDVCIKLVRGTDVVKKQQKLLAVQCACQRFCNSGHSKLFESACIA